MHRLRLFSIVILGLLVFAGGCSTGSASSSSSKPTAASVLTAAGDRWAATDTAHFKLTVEGDAFIDSAQSIKLLSAEGDLKRPDAVNADARIDIQITQANISLIAIGDKTWMTNFISGKWEVAPADFSYNPAVVFDEKNGIKPILATLQSAALGKDDSVGGRDTRVITGTVDQNAVSQVTSGSIQGDVISVTLWVDAGTNDLLRVSLKEPEGARKNPVAWTLDLSKQGEAVDIQPPPTS